MYIQLITLEILITEMVADFLSLGGRGVRWGVWWRYGGGVTLNLVLRIVVYINTYYSLRCKRCHILELYSVKLYNKRVRGLGEGFWM